MRSTSSKTSSIPSTFLTLWMVLLSLISTAHSQTPAPNSSNSKIADPKKAFIEGVTPFVKTYCAECHNDKRRKAGLNYLGALKNPGDTTSRRHWKQALANVKAHDMPPEDADNQPSEEEQQKFLDLIGTLKFLSPKAEVSHYGKADGTFIQWKGYGSESEAETTQIESPANTWLPSDRAGGSVAA